jgi:hypothetical protein
MTSRLKELARRIVPASMRRQYSRAVGNERVMWCRAVMVKEMNRFVRQLPCSQLDVLEISGETWSDPSFGFRSYKNTSYPGYDICEGVFPGEYDLVIAEQVFEHIMHPDRAARNVHAMLKSGGVFMVNTPFLLKHHEIPLDLYRWTELGLRTLLEQAGFSRIETGSWGNRACVMRDLTDDLEWAYYNRYWHSLKNDPRFPVMVWAFAWK